MITPLQKTPLREKLTDAIREWAKQESIDLPEKILSGISISLEIDEKPGTKNVGSIEWMSSAITDDDIKEILANGRITPEPRTILEEMLRTGTREITTKIIERLIETRNLHIKRLHDLEYSTYNKATNLNSLLTRLKLPYRVDSLRLSGKTYQLRKVKLTTTTIIDSNKKIRVNILGRIRVKGSRYARD
jgi:hypothetical protein